MEHRRFAGMNPHYYYYPLDYFLDAQVRAGFESVDLFGGSPHVWFNWAHLPDCAAVKRLLRERGLALCAFTPEVASCHYPLCSPDPDWREKSVAYFCNAVRIAAELEAPVMVAGLVGAFRDEDAQEVWKRAADALDRVSRLAGREGVALALKPVARREDGYLSTLGELSEMLGRVEGIRPALDTSAMRAAGESAADWASAYGGALAHVHLTDSRSGERLVWGAGGLPLRGIVDALEGAGYAGSYGMNLANYDYYDEPARFDRENHAALLRLADEEGWKWD